MLKNRSFPYLSLLLILGFLLSGCAPYQYSRYPAPQQPPSTTPSGSQPTDVEPIPDSKQPVKPATEIVPVKAEKASTDDAVSALINQAWSLNRNGDYERSNSTAERAQRLNSSNAEVYLIMASNYFSLSQLRLAEQLARQGLSASQTSWAIKQKLDGLLQRIHAVQ